MDFVIEFGDTFSWFCAILIKLELIAKGNSIDGGLEIEGKLREIYGKDVKKLKCSQCKTVKCKCIFFYD